MADLFGKTMIGGTSYNITGGTTLVTGIAHSITQGKTLKDGTVYEVNKKYTLKDLLRGSISFKGTRNHSSSLYQLTYNSFSASNAGETWYCFTTNGPRLYITKVYLDSSKANLTQLQGWSNGSSIGTALSANGFNISGPYSYGGYLIFIKFNTYSTDIVDEVLSNCQGKIIQGRDSSSTYESIITINPSTISSSGILFCAFDDTQQRWCFNEANSPTDSIRTYMGSFVTDKTIIIDYNNGYALSSDGTSVFTYRAYGYTVACIF